LQGEVHQLGVTDALPVRQRQWQGLPAVRQGCVLLFRISAVREWALRTGLGAQGEELLEGVRGGDVGVDSDERDG
jgi:hypothetical protein